MILFFFIDINDSNLTFAVIQKNEINFHTHLQQ